MKAEEEIEGIQKMMEIEINNEKERMAFSEKEDLKINNIQGEDSENLRGRKDMESAVINMLEVEIELRKIERQKYLRECCKEDIRKQRDQIKEMATEGLN